MNVTIITVGKLKERYLKEGIEEYTKRLGRYCKLEIIEVLDERAPEYISAKDEELIKKKEGENIKKHFKDGWYKIALCIDGKMMTSEELSVMINNLGVNGQSNVLFVIGGSLGLSDDVISICDLKLSFSRMTFPHQLMRLILLEQIYRAFKIIYNETYHK